MARAGSSRAVIALTAMLIAAYWVVESLLDTFLFRFGPFLDNLLQPQGHELTTRILVSALLAGLGIVLAADARNRRLISGRARQRADLLELRSRLAEIFLTIEGPEVYRGVMESLCVSTKARAGFFGILERDGRLRIHAVQCKGSDPAFPPEDIPAALEAGAFPADVAAALSGRKAVVGGPQTTVCGMPCSSMAVVPILGRDAPLGVMVLARAAGAFQNREIEMLASVAAYLAPILHSLVMSQAREEQVIQAQKMEALGALTGGISHDFNNILQAVMGFAIMAREDVPSGSRAAADLDRVLRAAERGRDLVQRIQMVSHAENREFIETSLVPTVQETCDLLRRSIPATISIRTRLDHDCPHVFADPAQIQQVLLNLATNAFHAMEKAGGEITITLAGVSAGAASTSLPSSLAGKDLVVLTVADTGCGMDPGTMKRLFDPFYTTKEVGKGTGLGLSVVHGIVSAHRGAITVQSEPESGTTVSIHLPALTRAAEAVVPAGAEVERRSGRILLIDDEQDIVQIAKAFLESRGYSVAAFTDGKAAIEEVRRDPGAFDLVISDLTMPHLSGDQLAAQVRAAREDLPVLLITGFSERQENPGEDNPSIKGLIQKPFTSQALARAAAAALRGEAGRPQETSWPGF